MFVMYDSVTLSEIPNEPHAVLAYINGEFANYDEAKVRFPHARLLPTSVTGQVVAECYDLEKGDYLPQSAGVLWEFAHTRGVERPCMYASLSNMDTVKSSLAQKTSARDTFRLLVADWNGLAQLIPGYDGHQFTNHALGRNLDESILASDFFAPAKPKPHKLDAFKGTFDREDGRWTIQGTPAEEAA